MKKIVLSVMVVGALLATSCKGEKKDVKETTEEVKTEIKKEVEKAAVKVEETKKEVSGMIESALDGITIPKFENEKVTKHLQDYASYAKDYIASKGDVLKKPALVKKGAELLAEGKSLVSSLDEKSAAKFKSVMSAIQSKMAPSK
jgi:hypothetical protein